MKKILSLNFPALIFLVVSLAAIPSIFVLLHSGIYHIQTFSSQARHDRTAAYYHAVSRQELLTEDVLNTMLVLSHEKDIRKFAASGSAETFSLVLGEHRIFSALALLDAQGNIVSASAAASSSTSDIGDFLALSRANRTFIIGETGPSLFGQGDIVRCAVPLFVNESDFTGTLYGELSTKAFAANLEGMNLPEKASVWIFDRYGNVITSLHGAFAASGEQGEAARTLWENMRLAGGESGVFEYEDDGGTERTVLFRQSRIDKHPTPYLGVLLSIPSTEAYLAAVLKLLSGVGLILLAALFVLAIGVVLSRKFYLRPAERLTFAVERAAGDGGGNVARAAAPLFGELAPLGAKADEMLALAGERLAVYRDVAVAMEEQGEEERRKMDVFASRLIPHLEKIKELAGEFEKSNQWENNDSSLGRVVWSARMLARAALEPEIDRAGEELFPFQPTGTNIYDTVKEIFVALGEKAESCGCSWTYAIQADENLRLELDAHRLTQCLLLLCGAAVEICPGKDLRFNCTSTTHRHKERFLYFTMEVPDTLVPPETMDEIQLVLHGGGGAECISFRPGKLALCTRLAEPRGEVAVVNTSRPSAVFSIIINLDKLVPGTEEQAFFPAESGILTL